MTSSLKENLCNTARRWQPENNLKYQLIVFILASASPARRRLLIQVGINHRIIVSGFDENKVHIEDPRLLVQSLAQSKAEAVSRKILHYI